MKIIFSRKGFDSSYGGMPSPILPDGSLLSLPIPSKGPGARRLDSITLNGRHDHVDIAFDLSNGRISGSTTVHLDPDLCADNLPRVQGWMPSFGQVGSAQGHLSKLGVNRGDLFLFFGWFRQTERHNGKWLFSPDAPDIHVLFGWLQIGEIISAGNEPERLIHLQYPWLKDHPHSNSGYSANNTIYIAPRALDLNQRKASGIPGGGIFTRYDLDLQLTKPLLQKSRMEKHPLTLCREGRNLCIPATTTTVK